jgi:hypothetical protein
MGWSVLNFPLPEKESIPFIIITSSMFAQLAKKSATKISTVGARSISRTASKLGHEGHHQHYTFEGDFSKTFCQGLGIFIVVGGIGATVSICKYQNYKNGFPRVEE